MNRRARLFLLAVLLARALTAQAAAPPAVERLSLQEALALAWDRHVSVIVGAERVQQALARLAQARSVLLPRVTASAAQSRQTRNLEAQGIALTGREPVVGPFNSLDARLKVTQTLFDLAAIQRLRAARTGEQQSLAEWRKAKEDATALVAMLYLEAWRAGQRLEWAQLEETLAYQALRIANTQWAQGTGSQAQYQEAEAAYASARQQWQAAVTQAAQRLLDLLAALGLDPARALTLTDATLPLTVTLPDPGDLVTLVRQHPEVQIAQARTTQQHALTAARRAEGLPVASAAADYGASGKDPSESESTYSVGAQVSMPLFEGGLRLARVREEAAHTRALAAQQQDIQLQVTAQVMHAVQDVRQAEAALGAAHAAWEHARLREALARQQCESGLGSAWDALEARVQLARARDVVEEAISAETLAVIQVAHAAGAMEQLAQQP